MNFTQRTRRKRAGFTMIELLVVIVIIGILAAAVFRLMGSANTKTAIAKTTAQVHAIATLLEEYKAHYGNYPLVTNISNEGYSPLNFTFKAHDGGGCSTCNNNPTRDNVQFGLCSHFIPRATTIYNYTHGDDMEGHYDSRFKDPSQDDVWEKELGGTQTGNSLDKARRYENVDPNLQQIYRAWRRLAKDRMVSEGVASCQFCGTTTYSAGAGNDAWGRGLMYRNDGGAGEIVSAGPDGTFGTGDDIVSGGAATEEDDQFEDDDED